MIKYEKIKGSWKDVLSGEELSMKMKRLQVSTVAALALAAVFAIVPAKQAAAAPAAPTDVKQTVSTQDGFKVTWTKVTGATDYMVSFSADGKSFTTEESTKGASEFAKLDPDKKLLKPGTTYIVKVRAIDGSGSSAAVSAKAATAPEVMTSFEQIGATTTTAKLSWTASAGANGYLIKIGADAASAKDLTTVTTTTVNLTSLKPDSAYYVAVYPIRKVTDKFYASDKCAYNNRVVTVAEAVQKVSVAEWDVRRNYFRLSWKNSAKYEGGYQVEVDKADGKVWKTFNLRGRKLKGASINVNKLKNKAFTVKVRTYNKFGNEYSYGDWSEVIYCVPEANVTTKKLSVTSVQLDWAKIAGAKKYNILAATEDGGEYKKIATTKNNSYTVSNLATGKNYYFVVRPIKVKVGGKKKGATELDVANDVPVCLLPGKGSAEFE